MIAAVIPGQGKIGEDFYDRSCPHKSTWYSKCETVLGRKITQDRLQDHDVNSALILANAFALDDLIKERFGDRYYNFVSGYSVGQYGALALAGGISKDDALVLVINRARLMVKHLVEKCGMLGIVGLKQDLVERLVGQCRSELPGVPGSFLEITNYSSGFHFTVGGDQRSLALMAEKCKVAKARKLELLQVAGAWHSTALNGALQEFGLLLDSLTFSVPRINYVDNIEGTLLKEPLEIRGNLKKHLVSPVRWDRCMQTLIEHGVKTVFELGSGHQLSTFFGVTDRSVVCKNISTHKDIVSCVESLG